MKTLSALTAATAILVASPAFAFHCPTDAAAIDEALAALEVGEEVESEARSLRDEGMEQHEAGNHTEAVNTLAEGMRLILTNVE